MSLDEIQQAARDQFDRQSSKYGKSHILAATADVEAALNKAEAGTASNGERHRHALDIATGGGHTALCLARHGYSVTISDVSPVMLENATRLLADEGFSPQAVREEAAESLAYADGSFDLVTCRVAPHHFSDPAAFVAQAARVLRPGGALVVIDGTVADGVPEAEAWSHAVEKLRDPSHGRFLRPNQWRQLCADAGLEVESCELQPKEMPDLEWYFEAAATPPENRHEVRRLVREAPEEAKRIFQLSIERGDDGREKVTWWWQIVTLVARKPS